MLPFPVSPSNTAVLLIDLQKGYCDPHGDAAQTLGWDCHPLHEVCQRHLPFIKKLRKILPAPHLIWARFEEHEDTMAPNIPMKQDEVFHRLCLRGTPGFAYHLVSPLPLEAEVLKFHPSAFHKDARVHMIGAPETNESHSLPDYLKSLNVDTLVFTGVLATRCVYGSILGASIFGFNCLCLSDLMAVPEGEVFQNELSAHEITRNMFYAYPFESEEFLSLITREGEDKNGKRSA
ncbi:MAG: cysteine hydrolase family protein [Bdellovibrionales bacterium]